MQIKGWRYDVKVEVEFSGEEVDYLIARAKSHYDGECQAAGMSYEDGARSNGFIKQLKLFPGPAFWTSSQIDLTLKVLEWYTSVDTSEIRDRLHRELMAAWSELRDRHAEANNVG
jgi:hypothetical protein